MHFYGHEMWGWDNVTSPSQSKIPIQTVECSAGGSLMAHPCVQYIPRNMHTVFALLCFVVVIHWLIFPYPSGLLHWHCGNLTIAPVPAKQPWWIWINTWCEFIMNDCITTTKQSTTKPCAYFLGYTVSDFTVMMSWHGNLLWVTGPFGRNPPGIFPSHRDSHANLWYFLWYTPKQTVEQTRALPLISHAVALTWRHCNANELGIMILSC